MGRGGFGGRGGRGGGRGGGPPGGGGGAGGFSPNSEARGMGRGGGFEGRFEDHTTYAVPAEKCGLVIGKGKWLWNILHARWFFKQILELF